MILGEGRWEDKEVSFTDSQGTPEVDQTAEEHVPSCYIELGINTYEQFFA